MRVKDYVALMWYKVAKCSKDQFEQLTAYQNAIEALRVSGNLSLMNIYLTMYYFLGRPFCGENK